MGGGAMRTAAKMAGITVANSGLRGITSDHYPVFSATRRSASSRSGASMVEDLKLVASQPQAGVKTTSSEIEDWVFAGGDEATVSDADSMPRVVFGGSPTLQEAKEATSELAVALEKAYLSSSDSVGRDCSLVGDDNSSLSMSGSQVMDCVTSEIGIPTAHATRAFRFLHDSAVAQNIVASIACDPNVWNAVLHNQELQEFMQSQRTFEGFAYSDSNQSCTDSNDVASEYSESQPDSGFVDIIEKVKVTVVDMMSNLSDYFQSFFGGQGVNRVISSSDGSANAETVMEASFVGLAVMAIMVILVKRA